MNNKNKYIIMYGLLQLIMMGFTMYFQMWTLLAIYGLLFIVSLLLLIKAKFVVTKQDYILPIAIITLLLVSVICALFIRGEINDLTYYSLRYYFLFSIIPVFLYHIQNFILIKIGKDR